MIAVVVALVLMLGGGGGDTGSPRGVAQAFVSAVNDKKQPDKSIFCDAFVTEGEEAAKGLPGGDAPSELPDLKLKATLGDVQEAGDSATATVNFEMSSAGQAIKGDYTLTIKKEGGAWKICDLEVGNIEVPGIGG